MNFAVASVNHEPLEVRLVDEHIEQILPHALVSPTAKTSVGILPVTIVWRQISPGGASAKNPENCVDELTIVPGPSSPGSYPTWEMGLELFPYSVGNIMASMSCCHG